MPIYIFSRAVRSGKTTELMHAFAERIGAAGVLMPDIDGRRHIYELDSKSLYPTQLDENSTEAGALRVGKFLFSKLSFQKAERAILGAIKTKSDWLVIDEIGKLELENNGFHLVVEQCLKAYENNMIQRLLLVVRDSLCQEVIEKYNLQKAEVIHDLSPLKLAKSST